MAGRHTINPNKRAIVICSREPVAGRTKTRMMPYLTAEQCAELHICFLNDLAEQCRKTDADVVMFYTVPEGLYADGVDCPILRDCFGEDIFYFDQEGADIWERMDNALRKTFDLGYKSCILIGTDIPELEAESFEYAFDMLTEYDMVIGPSVDGGYHLIGMNEPHSEPFTAGKSTSHGHEVSDTIAAAEAAGLKAFVVDTYQDMDDREAIRGYRDRMREDAELRNSHTGRFLRDCAKVSVIVPVYNEEKLIVKMQDQLRPYASDAEIIFVDGGSTDRTLELITDEFTVIHSEKGRANQMNAGAMASDGDILFFLHCDSVLPENFLDEIRHSMAKSEYGCFGVRFDSRHFFMWTNRIISNHRAWGRGIPFCDQGIFIDRELFFEIGMFPVLPIMEDYEFAKKLKRYGYRPAKTKHRIGTSARRYGSGTLSIMKTEYKMWYLRRLHNLGIPADEIARRYRDIR